jgi:hypothetical protein
MEHNITDVIDARIRCLVLLVNDAMLLTSYSLHRVLSLFGSCIDCARKIHLFVTSRVIRTAMNYNSPSR